MTDTPPPSLRDRITKALSTAAQTQPCTCGRTWLANCCKEHTPSPTDRRAAAVLAVVQPELDRLTTALEVATAQHMKAVTARDKAQQHAKTSNDIAAAERELFQTAIRDLGGNPVEVQNLYAQLNSRTRQWEEANAEIARLRAEVRAQGDALVRRRDHTLTEAAEMLLTDTTVTGEPGDQYAREYAELLLAARTTKEG